MKTLRWLPLLVLAPAGAVLPLIGASLLALLALPGCAGLGGQLAQVLITANMKVGFPAALDFPDQMLLNLSAKQGEAESLGRDLFKAVAGGSIEDKAGKAIKKAGLPVREITAKAFRGELEKARVFGAVVDGQGDFGLGLGVSRWGLDYDAAAAKIVPVLDLQATLSFKGIQVWKGTRSASQVSADVKSRLAAVDLAGLVTNAGSLKGSYELIALDLSRQLVEEMRSRPPKLAME